MDTIIEELNKWQNKEIEHEEKEVCQKCFNKIYTSKSKEAGLCFRCRTPIVEKCSTFRGYDYGYEDYKIIGLYEE